MRNELNDTTFKTLRSLRLYVLNIKANKNRF
jgi:hypothetical protein